MVRDVNMDYAIRVENGWDKLVELITHVANEYKDHPRYSKTKLAKVLYHSDFDAFRLLCQPITGIEYRKFPNGPLGTAMYEAISEADHLETLKKNEHNQEWVVSSRAANLEIFSAEELDIINGHIARLRDMTAPEVAEQSHGFAWSIENMKDPIPYQSAFLAEPDSIVIDDEDREFAKGLIGAGQ